MESSVYDDRQFETTSSLSCVMLESCVSQHLLINTALASCLIYARAFIEYVCGCVLLQDVTVREIRRR